LAAKGDAGARVGAVLVTFHPDPAVLPKVIASVVPQITRLVIVDNGSSDLAPPSPLPASVELLRNPRNMGIATALNRGVARLREGEPLDWILTLDQDTELSPDYVQRLVSAVDDDPKRDRIGIVTGALPHESTGTQRLLPESYVYTTGNLVRAQLFDQVRFRDEFFMDQVDHDFSYQVRARGYEIRAYDAPLFSHVHGAPSAILGRSIGYEPSGRFYYIVRNSTVLLSEGRFPVRLYVRQMLQWGALLALHEGVGPAARSIARGLADALGRRLGAG
jgi:rhamnosyltransferase